MFRFEGEYFIFHISFGILANIFFQFIDDYSPEEPTLSTFQKPFKLSHNVPVSSPFSSIAQRMEWASNTREHENYCSIEMDQLDLLLTLICKFLYQLTSNNVKLKLVTFSYFY